MKQGRELRGCPFFRAFPQARKRRRQAWHSAGITFMATSIQERLRILRGGLSQQAFAGSLGMAQTTLGRYERGESQPDLSFIQAVCLKLHINAGWLVLGEEPMYRNARSGGVNMERRSQEIERLRAQCARMEEELDKEREDRRQLQDDLQKLNGEIRTALKENVVLREESARLRERARLHMSYRAPLCGKDAHPDSTESRA